MYGKMSNRHLNYFVHQAAYMFISAVKFGFLMWGFCLGLFCFESLKWPFEELQFFALLFSVLEVG